MWKDLRDYSVKARKVFRVLTTMLEACGGLPSNDIRADSLGSEDKQMMNNLPAVIPSSGQTTSSQGVPMDLAGFDWVSCRIWLHLRGECCVIAWLTCSRFGLYGTH